MLMFITVILDDVVILTLFDSDRRFVRCGGVEHINTVWVHFDDKKIFLGFLDSVATILA